ncbi:MAG: IS200/IS605 family transposase [Candidatus Sumerlaeia bacterium]|nr:IS200/IS605 family transposase [Candidatus Sumerlaeia bacterium]
MSQTLVFNSIHLIWSTKNRTPWLRNNTIRERLHSYLAGIANRLDSTPYQIGGVEDHVHLYCSLSKNIALKDLVLNLKKDSSKWIKVEYPELSDFSWQAGYGGFSISHSHGQILKEYILNQEVHHKKMTFQEEFREICKKNHVQIDEQYVWD